MVVPLEKELCLNLGCGLKKIISDKTKIWINCDSDPGVKPDKIFDFTKRFPFKTNSVDVVFTSHTLEHIPQELLVNITLPEIWRVCKKNASVRIIVPYMDAQPVLNHYIRFHEETFNNWCRGCYKSSDTFPFKFSFHVKKIELGKSKRWGWVYSLMPLKLWRGLWSHLVEEIRVDLKAEK